MCNAKYSADSTFVLLDKLEDMSIDKARRNAVLNQCLGNIKTELKTPLKRDLSSVLNVSICFAINSDGNADKLSGSLRVLVDIFLKTLVANVHLPKTRKNLKGAVVEIFRKAQELLLIREN